MKQFPSRLKYKKNHKIKSSVLNLAEQKVFFPSYGTFCIKSLESGKLSFKQIEACRKSMRRNVKKVGIIWIRVFTYFSVTKKAIGARMGKGKGNHSKWICPIRCGQVICEISGVSSYLCLKALKSASSKLPFKTSVKKVIY